VLAYPIARHIYEKVIAPMHIGNIDIVVKPSMGIAAYPESNNADDLLRHSDLAMYEAKKRKDHFVHFYNQKHELRRTRQQAVEHQLTDCFNPNEFTVLYQPIYCCAKNTVSGAEALLRWQNATLGAVEPEEFIPIAEWNECDAALFSLVFERVVQTLSMLSEGSVELPKISINVTAKQFSKHDFAQKIINMVQQNPNYGELLCLEITERQIVENTELCRFQLLALKKLGIKIAVDDYGTGFSSITHLKQLPIDIIKIDRSLASGLKQFPENLALTAGVIEMAHRLNMEVIAEGIEEESDWQTLQSLGCDYFQGFFKSKPVSREHYMDIWSQHLRDKN